MNIDALKVRPGEEITPAWKRLVAWVQSLREVQAGEGLRIHRTATQTTVIADARRAAFIGAFYVRLSGKAATLTPGQIEGKMPRLNGVPLDGIDDQGNTLAVPPLQITEGPSAQLKSWIVLQVRADPKTRQITDEPDALTIQHVNTLATQPEIDQGLAHLPLARLEWFDTVSIRRTHQIVYFDQHFRYLPRTDKFPAQALFSPAA